MKKTIKGIVFGMVTLSFIGLYSVPLSWAVSDEDFKALQQQVQQQNQLLQQLLKANQEDQDEIKRLKDQLSQTQQKTDAIKQTADQAAQTAQAAQMQAAPKVQPVAPVLHIPQENHNFVVAGDAEVQYIKHGGAGKDHGSFVFSDFAPVFLFRANDKVLFEAGFDTTLSNGTTSLTSPPAGSATGTSGNKTKFNLTFAQLDYLFNDYVTLVAGKMLLPLGTYSERSAGWLNKIADDPTIRSLLPSQGVGVQVRGSKAIGTSGQMLTYAFYSTNGVSEVEDAGNQKATTVDGSGNIIQNLDLGGNVTSLNHKPSEGGRIGWFYPLKPHYDIELGISGENGAWDRAGRKLWQAGVLDAALHISPYFETKGEYIYTMQQTADLGTIKPRGWWVQLGFKMSAFDWEIPMVPKTELVFRYDTVNYDINRLTGIAKSSRRYTPGIVYYMTNTLWFEASYEKILHDGGAPSDNQWLLQLSYGF